MRWNVKQYQQVTKWFAWHPVRIGRRIIWWEWVWRSNHNTPFGGFYEYGFHASSFDKDGYLVTTED